MDVLVFKVPAPQRQSAKLKVSQLKYDVSHLQAALNNYQQKKERRAVEISEREELLTRRFHPNSETVETAIELDYSLQHHNQMNVAHRGVDDMLMTGKILFTSICIVKLLNIFFLQGIAC